jgi:hypothetical protein
MVKIEFKSLWKKLDFANRLIYWSKYQIELRARLHKQKEENEVILSRVNLVLDITNKL